MKITKILAQDATPAKAILDRAQHIALTYAQRQSLPRVFQVGEATLEVALEEERPLESGDILLDDAGHFYVIAAHEEAAYRIKGEEEAVNEAVVALLARGVPVSECGEEDFAVLADPELGELLKTVGLDYEEVTIPFEELRLEMDECECGEHHEHGEGCCCGGHGHHHHEHGEGCGCGGQGHHHHEHGEGCGCGGHGHHHHEHGEGCGCGGQGHHHHEHGEGCGSGGHGHHDHEHGKGCGCGGQGHHHHHHHEEGGCCCGRHKADEENKA